MSAADLAPPAPIAQAFAAHQAGRADLARDLYARILAEAPATFDAWQLLALIAKAEGGLDRARRLLRRALLLDARVSAVWMNLANAAQEALDPIEAEGALTRAHALAPDAQTLASLIRVRDALALAAEARGDAAEAARWLRAARALAPERLDLIDRLLPLTLEGDCLEALDLAHAAWRLSPEAARHANLWALSIKAGADPERIASALDGAQPSATTALALGNALRRKRLGRAAEVQYRAAMRAMGAPPVAAGRLACLLLEQGRLEEADRLFRQAAEPRGDGAPILGSQAARESVMRCAPRFLRDLARRPLDAPPADFAPLKTRRPIIVFAACDGVYFDRFASALVASAWRNGAIDCAFHLHVIDPPADLGARIAHLDAVLGGPGIAVSTSRLDPDLDPEGLKTRYACERFRLLPHVLRAYQRPVLTLDADLLVLRPLDEFVASAWVGDLALVATDPAGFEPWNWFWADVIFTNNSPLALEFVDLVAAYVGHFLDQGRAVWFLDQIALTMVWQAGFIDRPKPRLVPLPTDIHRLKIVLEGGIDREPEPHVLFWSAHASTLGADGVLSLPRYRDYLVPWPPAPDAGAGSA